MVVIERVYDLNSLPSVIEVSLFIGEQTSLLPHCAGISNKSVKHECKQL